MAEEELYEAEEALQAGSEESLAAAQDALRCLQPTALAVGYVHLAAASVVSAMAQVRAGRGGRRERAWEAARKLGHDACMHACMRCVL